MPKFIHLVSFFSASQKIDSVGINSHMLCPACIEEIKKAIETVYSEVFKSWQIVFYYGIINYMDYYKLLNQTIAQQTQHLNEAQEEEAIKANKCYICDTRLTTWYQQDGPDDFDPYRIWCRSCGYVYAEY